jgi:hypothetical protein
MGERLPNKRNTYSIVHYFDDFRSRLYADCLDNTIPAADAGGEDEQDHQAEGNHARGNKDGDDAADDDGVDGVDGGPGRPRQQQQRSHHFSGDFSSGVRQPNTSRHNQQQQTEETKEPCEEYSDCEEQYSEGDYYYHYYPWDPWSMHSFFISHLNAAYGMIQNLTHCNGMLQALCYNMQYSIYPYHSAYPSRCHYGNVPTWQPWNVPYSCLTFSFSSTAAVT